MAIAFDTSAYAGADYTTTGAQTAFNITGGTNARGIVVLVEQNGTNADQISSVTYTNSTNGITNAALTEIAAVGESSEAGFVYIFFLDCKTNGLGSVQVTTTGTAVKSAVAATMTVTNNATNAVMLGNVAAVDGSTAASNPTITITGLQNISHCFFGVIHSGLQTMTTTPGTPFNATALRAIDRGSQGYGMAQGVATVSGGQQACTWTAATSEDYAFAAAAFYEVPLKEGAAGAVSVTSTTSGALTRNRVVDSGAVSVTPTTSANAVSFDPTAYLAIDISGTQKTYGTITGRLGLKGPILGEAGQTTVTNTESAVGNKTALFTAGATTVTSTPSAAGAVSKSVVAGQTSVDVTETAVTGIITRSATAGAVTVDVTETAVAAGTSKPSTAGETSVTSTEVANAGLVTKPVTAGQVSVAPSASANAAVTKFISAGAVTVDVTETADLSLITKTVTAGQITDSPTTNAVAGNVTKPVTADVVTVTPTTTASPSAASDAATAGLVTVGPTATANASVTKFISAPVVQVAPQTSAAFTAWRTIFLKPDAILTMSNLSGSVSDIQDSPSAPDGNGLLPTGSPVSVRFSFENPNEQLRTNANDQTIRVLVTAV